MTDNDSTAAIKVVLTRSDLQRLRIIAAKHDTTPPRLVRDAIDAMLRAGGEPPLEPLQQLGWGGPRVSRKKGEGT